MQPGKIAQALIAFGTNLPFQGASPAQVVAQAVAALGEQGLVLTAFSGMFQTPALPVGAGPDYVNAVGVIALSVGIDPAWILGKLHAIEADFGRERGQRWAMRTLDLDLLGFGDSVLPDSATQDHWRTLPSEMQARQVPDQLILPHPRLQDRAFVLVPLVKVAPDWRHPRTGLTVRQMLARLPKADRDAVKPLRLPD